jgi:hypothetical protein
MEIGVYAMILGIFVFALFWFLCGLVAYDICGLCLGQPRWRK